MVILFMIMLCLWQGLDGCSTSTDVKGAHFIPATTLEVKCS